MNLPCKGGEHARDFSENSDDLTLWCLALVWSHDVLGISLIRAIQTAENVQYAGDIVTQF
jgi:hypothetical protein